MEEARCWMLNKRKHSLSSNNLPYDDSWEEQAFAEDSAGPLGGCIWPPRSYSCSFCRREFRSAQALGGHMNVHRRDRARLKQSPSPQNNEIVHQNHHNLFQNQFTSLGFQCPSHQICTLVYNPNPNSDPPTRENCNEKNLFPHFSSYSSTNTSIKEEHEKRSPESSSPSRPNSDPKRKEERNSRTVEPECRAKVDYVKTNDLSVSLNLVVRRTGPNEEEEEEEDIGCKRRRITSTTTSSLPLFMKSNSEVFEISPCSREELDLELRLGDRPKGNSEGAGERERGIIQKELNT